MVKGRNDYVDFVVDRLGGLGNVYSQRLFGGYAIFHEGLTFALVADDVLYFKVDETNKEMYDRVGSSHFPHPISYREVPADVFEDIARLYEWAEISIVVAKAKAKKKRR